MSDQLKLKVGGLYNWIGQPERLVYMGYNWSGNGYWHQFRKVDGVTVWCEVKHSDLPLFEATKINGTAMSEGGEQA